MPRSMPLTFFFNDTATTEIYTLSLHDALPISTAGRSSGRTRGAWRRRSNGVRWINLSLGDHWKIDVEQISRCAKLQPCSRSEEHTSELQSQSNIVWRLLLAKKKISTTARCLTN